MSTDHTVEAAWVKLDTWRKAHADLLVIERELSTAMLEYSRELIQAPRQLIVTVEAQRAWTSKLFDEALEALNAHATMRAGLTDFGSLS